jgi:hypothetical protein
MKELRNLKDKTMIKVEFTIKYYESYIPYRCRKPRYNEITESVFAMLREVTMADVKLAFGIDWADKFNIYFYKGKLYKEYKLHSGIINSYGDITALDWFVNYSKIYSSYFSRPKDWSNYSYDDYSNYETKEDIIKRIKKTLSNLLVIDGVLYESCGYPFYDICTFGLCGNHGGTGMCVSYTDFPKKLDKGWCFSPYKVEDAIARANEVATNRYDTNDVGTFKQSIFCHLPELEKKYSKR